MGNQNDYGDPRARTPGPRRLVCSFLLDRNPSPIVIVLGHYLTPFTTGIAFVFEKMKLVIMPQVTEVIETVLYVRDVERAERWYQKLFDFPVIFREGDRLRALKVGAVQVLLLFKEGASKTATVLPGGVIPPHDGSGPMHLAFGMKTEDADHWEKCLIANGVAIEGRVQWREDDKSIYFRDPDNHLVELITSEHWGSRQEGTPNN